MGMRKQLLSAIAWLCLLASSSTDHCGMELIENKQLDFEKLATDSKINITELLEVTLLAEDEDVINQCMHTCCDSGNDDCNFAIYDPAVTGGPSCRLYSCYPAEECTVIDKDGSFLIVYSQSAAGDETEQTKAPTTAKTSPEPNVTSTVEKGKLTATNAADDNGDAGNDATPPATEQTQVATEGTKTTVDAATPNTDTEDVSTNPSTEAQGASEQTEGTVDVTTTNIEPSGVSTNPSTDTNTSPKQVPETTLVGATTGISSESAQTTDSETPTMADTQDETIAAKEVSTETSTTENNIDNADRVTESEEQNETNQTATTTNTDTGVSPSSTVTTEAQQTYTGKTEVTAITEETTLIPVESTETEETLLDQTTEAETKSTSVETGEVTDVHNSTGEDEFLSTTPITTDYDEYDNTSNDTETTFAQKTGSLAMSSALIAALSFGILFSIAVGFVIVKLCHSSWQRRHYSRIDYLVNGMYN